MRRAVSCGDRTDESYQNEPLTGTKSPLLLKLCKYFANFAKSALSSKFFKNTLPSKVG